MKESRVQLRPLIILRAYQCRDTVQNSVPTLVGTVLPNDELAPAVRSVTLNLANFSEVAK